MNMHKSLSDSRRRFLAGASLSAAAALFSRNPLVAREDGIVPTMVKAAANAKIKVQQLRRNISVVQGSGGNIAVLTGRDGKLLVDAGFAVSRVGVKSALDSLSSDPIKHLINTHWHIDHTDGNAWLHEAGASILAHEKTREHLSVATRVEGWSYTFPPAPAEAIPEKVFGTGTDFHLNDTSVYLDYYHPAHTDCDISVNFMEADVIHVGDTWWNGVYPFIDYSTGGSIDGTIRAADSNIAATTEKSIVIPGHGSVGNKQDLIVYRDMLTNIRDTVAELKQQGRFLDEVVAAKPTADYDGKWGQFLITPAMFTELVYRGV